MSNIKKVLLWTVIGTVSSVAITRFIGEPVVKWLESFLKQVPKSFNTPTNDNAAINLVGEGNIAIVKNYVNVPAIATLETQIFFNPFVENGARISRQLEANTPVGTLTGRFTQIKGITYAELRNTNNETGWANKDTIKPV